MNVPSITGVYSQSLQEMSATLLNRVALRSNVPLWTFVCIEIGGNRELFCVRLSQAGECVAGGGTVRSADQMVV